MRKLRKFPSHLQMDQMDCGPTCVGMVSEHHGLKVQLEHLRNLCDVERNGVSIHSLISAFEALSFEAIAVEATLPELIHEIPLPAIAHWEGNHYVVVHKATKNKIYVSDPQIGSIVYSPQTFLRHWTGGQKGILLLSEPNAKFFSQESIVPKTGSLGFLLSYFVIHRKYFLQLSVGLILGGLIQICLPFLTQSLIDEGIEYGDLSLIQVIVTAQILLLCFLLATDIFREWMLMQLSVRVNIKMISDFLDRIMDQPLAYFHSRSTGDFMQRIYDNLRIENFFGKRLLSIPFDLLTLLIFTLILGYFNNRIFLAILIGSLSFLSWSMLFVKRKQTLDNEAFLINKKEQSILFQMISAIREIKLNGSHERRKMEWKKNQFSLFHVQSRIMRIELFQLKGGMFLSGLMSILIIYWSALEVLEGSMTLGTMLAIQFILAAMAIPFQNILDCIVEYQRASLSIRRLAETQNMASHDMDTSEVIPITGKCITIKNLSFRYNSLQENVLDNINLTFASGSTTAIVGASGSGKTTLFHILLKLYPPSSGTIHIGDMNLRYLDTFKWMEMCGTVLQDGALFNDSLQRNITESSPSAPVDQKRLHKAIKMANLNEVIDKLPQGLSTILGDNGQFLSGGERQRVLIARMIYSEPEYVFLDEATSSLDAATEKAISTNLTNFLRKRTVIVIAHRLSTIRGADQIVVMDSGKIVEVGDHSSLLHSNGFYHNLISNQL